MLFIQYDSTYVLERGKYAHAGADYYGSAASPYPLPLVISFPRRKLAMHNRKLLLAEASRKAFYHLTCKGYLRHQHYGSLSLFQAFFDDFHIYLGLAAGSNSVEKKYFLLLLLCYAL